MHNLIGLTLRFGAGGNAEHHQLEGWSGGEDGFTWTLDKVSRITIPKFEAPYGYFVELQGDPLITPDILSQRVKLLMNDVEVGRVTMKAGGVMAFAMASPPPSDELTLTIEHPDCFVPTRPNERATALAVRSIRIIVANNFLPKLSNRSSSIKIDTVNDVDDLAGCSVQNLFMQYEILSGNCEFGGVQRLAGANALSLLRFAGASQSEAIKGLDRNFEGIGEHLSAEIRSDGISDEWMIFDPAYSLYYHSMLSSKDYVREKVLEMEGKKIAYLRKEFIEDLGIGDKVYIFADSLGLPKEAALALFLAIRRRGPGRLLWLIPDRKKEGLARELWPGLVKGYIASFGSADVIANEAIIRWLSPLMNAWRLFREY